MTDKKPNFRKERLSLNKERYHARRGCYKFNIERVGNEGEFLMVVKDDKAPIGFKIRDKKRFPSRAAAERAAYTWKEPRFKPKKEDLELR